MSVNHPEEVKIHRYLDDARKGKRGMSDATIARIVSDVKEAVEKQFNQKERKFTARMSNIGRPACQLWFEKYDADSGIEPSANFLMNMMIGDIVEAVFKGVLTEAGVDFSDASSCERKALRKDCYNFVKENVEEDVKEKYGSVFLTFILLTVILPAIISWVVHRVLDELFNK